MSQAARTLRRADEQQLRGVRAALARGHFVIVVADAGAWTLVQQMLGVEPHGEFMLETGDDVVQMFASPITAGEGVVFLHIHEHAAEATGALNLNRDKLRSRRCRFLLHLRDLAAFQHFVREASDCYSIRDAVAVIEPQKTVALGPAPELTPDIERRIAEERSPDALLLLGQELLKDNREDEGNRALERGLAVLTEKKRPSKKDRTTLGSLHYLRVAFATGYKRTLNAQEALHTLKPIQKQLGFVYTRILASSSDAYGVVVSNARDALETAEREVPRDPRSVAWCLMMLADAYRARNDTRSARDTLGRIQTRWLETDNRLAVRHIGASILVNEGRWREAMHHLEEALCEDAGTGFRSWVEGIALELSDLFLKQGEFKASIDVIASVVNEEADAIRRVVRYWQGDIDNLHSIEELFDVATVDDVPRVITAARAASQRLCIAMRTGLLEEQSLSHLDAALATLVARVTTVAPPVHAWPTIAAELLAADTFLARLGKEQDAAEAARRALALARAVSPELIAACVRRIVVATLRAGAAEPLDALLDEATHATEVHHLPGEAARIAGLRLWLAIQRGVGVGEAEAALEAAFTRSGSVLVQAEVLLRVGRGAGRRDLIGKARRIYHALPWPEREGACFEALGMKQAARDRYEAFGLRLAALAVERSPEPEPVDA